ncbi:hypothetical protein [Dysgonomonas sp. 520]|uniref:hypothetical protein n=1 Tax=Dysgonomonas sp. 520 TaxID=2302931 RepID=UPI0013D7896E|nr:hypothetical protein [Dysgonomonas sp. 520]NDW09285.1 hypothetical protein [Dysgonomonas sp. 520]
MKSIGSFLFIIGILAIVLDFVDRVPSVLVWIYTWGDGIAWIIKIAITVVGAILFLIGSRLGTNKQ